MPTPIEIAECINVLKTAYPNYQPDIKATADLWKTIFSDMEGETLKTAVIVCITAKREFAPSAGTIRAAALELHAKASGIPDAYFAYDEVCRMPAKMERWNETNERTESGAVVMDIVSLKFTHPLVEIVARLMGWPKTFPTDLPAADRSQFVKAYDAEKARYMEDSGALPVVKAYIEKKSETMRGDAPALMANITKRLENK